ncbi:ankyrin repeat domain-containing protein [Bremerella sp. JC817]|uniref:ankyrin repeat domain-containing protein n=1 Tax=Bremerella sp. JC817 TaxID=3231756 RepID=UPI003459F7D0
MLTRRNGLTTLIVIFVMLLIGLAIGGYKYAQSRYSVHQALANGDIRLVRSQIRNRLEASHHLRLNQHHEQWGLPLHVATSGSQAEVVEYLIELGADVNAETHDGMTPLFFCRSPNELRQVTNDQRSHPNPALEVQLILIDAGGNVNKPWGGITPLMWAVQNQDLPVAAALIHHGASVNATDHSFRTALDYARDIEQPIVRHRLMTLLTNHGGWSGEDYRP